MTQRNFEEWLTDVEILKERTNKRILQLNVSKAPGPDGLHPRLLKESSQQLAGPLEVIFQLSIRQGEVPSGWTKEEITAIHKKGSRRLADTYRPVSLTCIICKIIKSLIRETIIDHMRSNRLFSKYQSGFINRRSTIPQLLSLGHRQENKVPKLYLYSRKEDGSLEKVQLEQTEVEKDIRVYVDQELNFKEQITSKSNKANSTMGFIRRTIDQLDSTAA